VLQYGTLVYLSTHGLVNNLTIWAVLKVLSLFRCAGGRPAAVHGKVTVAVLG